MGGERLRRAPRWAWLLVAAAVLGGALYVNCRDIADYLNVPGEPDLVRVGMADYRDALYYPVRDMLEGNNPYDAPAEVRRQPVAAEFDLYGPHHLILWVPLVLLPYEASEVVFLILVVASTFVLAHLVLRLAGHRATLTTTVLVTGLLLLTHWGRENTLYGQTTTFVVLGAFLALGEADRRPLLAGAGVALAMLKPQFGVILLLVLLARRSLRAALVGAGVTGVLAFVGLVFPVAAAGGIGGFVDSIERNVEFARGVHRVQLGNPGSGRVDAAATVARIVERDPGLVVELLATFVVIGVGMVCVHHLRGSRVDSTGWHVTVLVACLAIVLGVIHQTYDPLVLALPVTVLLTRGDIWEPVLGRGRLVLAAAISLGAVPYTWVDRLGGWTGITFLGYRTLVGVGLIAGLAAAVWAVARVARAQARGDAERGDRVDMEVRS